MNQDMTAVMEVLDPSGHVTLRWNPDDEASVATARAEFARMKEAGFAFFVSEEPAATRVSRLRVSRGSLDARFVQTKEFKPRARRTVAVRPLRGG